MENGYTGNLISMVPLRNDQEEAAVKRALEDEVADKMGIRVTTITKLCTEAGSTMKLAVELKEMPKYNITTIAGKVFYLSDVRKIDDRVSPGAVIPFNRVDRLLEEPSKTALTVTDATIEGMLDVLDAAQVASNVLDCTIEHINNVENCVVREILLNATKEVLTLNVEHIERLMEVMK